jgi:hypothetical protein
MDEPKRVAIEVNKFEMAALLNHYTSDLAKLGKEMVGIVGLDQDELEWARRVALRVQELLKASEQLVD